MTGHNIGALRGPIIPVDAFQHVEPNTNAPEIPDLPQKGLHIAEAIGDHSSPISKRSVTQQKSLSFNNLKYFNSEKLTTIKKATTTDEARGTVNVLRRVVDFLMSRLIANYTTKSDAAAAIFDAMNGKTLVDSYKALRELVRPEERHHIKLELEQGENSDWALKLKVGDTEINQGDQQPLSPDDLSTAKALINMGRLENLAQQNPAFKIADIQSKIEAYIAGSQNKEEIQTKNKHQLIVDLPRSVYNVKGSTIKGFISDSDAKETSITGAPENNHNKNYKLFTETINKQLTLTTEQQTSIEALAHQTTMALIYGGARNLSDITYLAGNGQSVYTLNNDGEDIVLDIKFTTTWQDKEATKDFGPRPDAMKEPVVSIQVIINPDGDTFLNEFNFCTSK